MRKWVTSITAIDPKSGELKHWSGPEVPGISATDARNYCDNNGLGYCKIDGELVAEIPCKKDSYEPDFDKMIDYEKPMLN